MSVMGMTIRDGRIVELFALTDAEAQKILTVIIIQAPAVRTRNPVCGHCGTHCYGDCEASGA